MLVITSPCCDDTHWLRSPATLSSQTKTAAFRSVVTSDLPEENLVGTCFLKCESKEPLLIVLLNQESYLPQRLKYSSTS